MVVDEKAGGGRWSWYKVVLGRRGIRAARALVDLRPVHHPPRFGMLRIQFPHHHNHSLTTCASAVRSRVHLLLNLVCVPSSPDHRPMLVASLQSAISGHDNTSIRYPAATLSVARSPGSAPPCVQSLSRKKETIPWPIQTFISPFLAVAPLLHTIQHFRSSMPFHRSCPQPTKSRSR